MDRAVLKDFRHRVVGRRETMKQIRRGASAVYVARDADAVILQELEERCRANQIPIYYVDSMSELGRLCGIEVGAACAAVNRGAPGN